MAPKGPIEIRVDLVMPAMIEGSAQVIVSEGGTRNVMLKLNPETASDLATAALQSLTINPYPRAEGSDPETGEIDRQLRVAATGWVTPGTVPIQPGHSVLVLQVGGALLQFSAPTEAWHDALEKLIAAGSVRGSLN
ncbi:hypothetical protein [Devosia enhydra]|uniref:hypothetical protein n=1 Tax=Devosia enhydra TaxID=665118 RepID=UPI00116038F4|nr:hypothetical protein [Devosia enhydra]